MPWLWGTAPKPRTFVRCPAESGFLSANLSLWWPTAMLRGPAAMLLTCVTPGEARPRHRPSRRAARRPAEAQRPAGGRPLAGPREPAARPGPRRPRHPLYPRGPRTPPTPVSVALFRGRGEGEGETICAATAPDHPTAFSTQDGFCPRIVVVAPPASLFSLPPPITPASQPGSLWGPRRHRVPLRPVGRLGCPGAAPEGGWMDGRTRRHC